MDGVYNIEIPVSYNWIPPSCEGCKIFGHNSQNCPLRKVEEFEKAAPVKTQQKKSDTAGGVDVQNKKQTIDKDGWSIPRNAGLLSKATHNDSSLIASISATTSQEETKESTEANNLKSKKAQESGKQGEQHKLSKSALKREKKKNVKQAKAVKNLAEEAIPSKAKYKEYESSAKIVSGALKAKGTAHNNHNHGFLLELKALFMKRVNFLQKQFFWRVHMRAFGACEEVRCQCPFYVECWGEWGEWSVFHSCFWRMSILGSPKILTSGWVVKHGSPNDHWNLSGLSLYSRIFIMSLNVFNAPTSQGWSVKDGSCTGCWNLSGFGLHSRGFTMSLNAFNLTKHGWFVQQGSSNGPWNLSGLGLHSRSFIMSSFVLNTPIGTDKDRSRRLLRLLLKNVYLRGIESGVFIGCWGFTTTVLVLSYRLVLTKSEDSPDIVKEGSQLLTMVRECFSKVCYGAGTSDSYIDWFSTAWQGIHCCKIKEERGQLQTGPLTLQKDPFHLFFEKKGSLYGSFDWADRGLNDYVKQKEVRALIKKFNTPIVSLVETKVMEQNKDSIFNNIRPGWGLYTNYEHSQLGRIWLMWDPTVVSLTVIDKLDQAIFAEATLPDGQQFCVTIVYGSNSSAGRLHLWDRISHHARFKGAYLTWSNCRLGEDRVATKIDRVLINSAWFNQMPDTEAEFLNQGISDHSPMVAVIQKDPGNPMYQLVTKLKLVKSTLITWNHCKFNKLEVRVQGGLNNRNIETTNRAAIMRQIWALIARKDNIWVHWITKNYLRGRSLWSINPPADCSWCWRKLLQELGTASTMAFYTIGDGRETRLWYFHWHPKGPLLPFFQSHFTYDSDLNRNAFVSNIIQNGEWNIPTGLSTLVDDFSSLLGNVEIHNGSTDEVVWIASNKGNVGGCGTIIRTHMGSAVFAATGSSRGISVPFHELQGIRMRLQLAINKEVKRACLGSDSLLAIMYINKVVEPPWEAKWILKDIWRLIGLFEQFRIIHIFRETNKAADLLAGIYPGVPWLEIAVEDFCEALKKFIALDALGFVYERV
ncbi:hypothetical protein GIB67_014967 [Kingdonia uniflora]|uniref:RNase H type-1 domain-containing protein n=1 Tax=Kingdonia uniflora TaxID=39325 RepID=A0A7J7MTI2_9MAGN|nr:hypothetical protein GIB67_014967 [Kingdonia uniflora]